LELLLKRGELVFQVGEFAAERSDFISKPAGLTGISVIAGLEENATNKE
jgi:hypothetical protein